MTNTTIPLDSQYFHMQFGPVNLKAKDFGLKKIPLTNDYIDRDGNKWKSRLLYNTGWGRPIGYERLPKLQFTDLIALVLFSDYNNSSLSIREVEENQYGAAAVIMDEYVPELIDFLSEKIKDDAFLQNPLFLRNLRIFCFDSSYMKECGGNGQQSYESILSGYPEWDSIAKKIIPRVYSDENE